MAPESEVWSRHETESHWHFVVELHMPGSVIAPCKGRWPSDECRVLSERPVDGPCCTVCLDFARAS